MTHPADAPQAIACPSVEVIQAFAQGQMSHRDLSAVDRHLDSCPKCQARLATVAPGPDSLLDRLRRARGSSDTPADPAIEALMAGAKHLPYAAMAAPTLHFPGYRIMGKLGEGGCGTVYKVCNESMGGRLEALKTLKDPGDRHLHERLRQEIRAIAQLEHPNIIRAYHTGVANGLLFFTMELAAGCNLFELVQVRRRGPLAPAEACALVAQAAEGLQHAHDKQIIHRDVKPGNLLLTDQGVVKVLDLGLARLLELTTIGEPLTGGASPGTPRYMAPEQAQDAHTVDHRADIYGLGCTLSFLLTARHPTPGVPLAVPPNLGKVLERMLARDPNQRFGSARAVIEALRPFHAPGAVVAGLPAAPRPIVVAAAPASTVGYAAQSTVGQAPATARKPRVIAAPTAMATPVRTGPPPAVPAEPTSASGAAAPPVPADGMQQMKAHLWRFRIPIGIGCGGLTVLGSCLFMCLFVPNMLVRSVVLPTKDAIVAMKKDSVKQPKAPTKSAPATANIDKVKPPAPDNGAIAGKDQLAPPPGDKEAVVAPPPPPPDPRENYDFANVGQFASLSGHQGTPGFVEVSRDGRYLASGAGGEVLYWDIDRKTTLKRHVDPINTQTFALTTKNAVFIGRGDAIRFWNMPEGKLVRTAAVIKDADLWNLGFSDDGKLMAAAVRNGTFGVWNNSFQPVLQAKHGSGFVSLTFTRDEREIITGGNDRVIRRWAVFNGQQLASLEGQHEGGIGLVWVSPDKKRVISRSYTDNKVVVWDAASEKPLQSFTFGNRNAEIPAAISRDGRFLATGEGKSLVLREIASGVVIWASPDHDGAVTCVAFFANGRFAVSGGHDKLLRIWKLPAPK